MALGRKKEMITRCGWPGSDEGMIRYHDTEWGTPLHDDKKLFEFLVLDAFQAGLSWSIVLKKREGFRRAFAGFDPNKIALFTEKDVERLRADTKIIRNRLKIRATITNAQRFLAIQKKYGTFDAYIWQFTKGKTIIRARHSLSEIQSTSPESDAMSKQLIKDGFKFVGSTICYAFMQAAGMILDHTTDCFRYKEIYRSLL